MEELAIVVKFVSQYAKDGGAIVIILLCTMIMLYARSEYKSLRVDLLHLKTILGKILALHSMKYPEDSRILYDDEITSKDIAEKKSRK